MTSVSNQQYAPYHANYEMRPKPAPNQNEGSVENRQANSAPPRQPMPTQQRGQFSAHRGLVNSPASTTQAEPDRLAQLSKENQQLRGKLDQLVAQFTPVIIELRQQVANLTQQLNKPGEPAKEDSRSSPEISSGSRHSASPEASAPAENTPVSEQKAPQSLQQMTAENNQLRETVDRMQTQFNTIVKQLQEQIQALNKKLDGGDTPPAQTAPHASDAGVNSSKDSSSAAAAPDTHEASSATQANDATSSETRTVNDLLRDNEELRTRIEQMVTQFTQVISQLKQQIEELSARVKTQAA